MHCKRNYLRGSMKIESYLTHPKTLIASAFFLYCSIVALIGYWCRKSASANTYLIGGRGLNYWVTAISAQASDMGSWLFMGLPAVIFVKGLDQAWTAIGLVVGMFFNWHIIAPRLRTLSEEQNSPTIVSFFANRFSQTQGAIRLVSALILTYFFSCYISAGLIGIGTIFHDAFHISYGAGVLIGVAIIFASALTGGLISVAWTDLFQGIFLLTVIVLVPIYAYFHMGSAHAITTIAEAKRIGLSLFPADKSILSSILLALGWGLGYFGQPHVLINFMSIDSVKNMRKAQIVGMSWQLLCLIAAVAVGVVGIGFFPNGLSNSELVFTTMVQQLFHPFVAGIAFCAIIAAVTSTINSQILVLASVWAHDIYKHTLYPEAPSRTVVLVSRMGVLCMPLISAIIACTNALSIYDLVQYSWSGLGASFGPLLLVSLYGSTTRRGALAALIVGALTAIIVPLTKTSIPALVPGFAMSFLAAVLCK